MEKLIKTIMLLLLAAPLMANCGNNNGQGNGCSNDDDTGIVGPAGPQGPQGVAGPKGANGTNGSDVTSQAAIDRVNARVDQMNEFHTYFEPEIQVFDTQHFNGSVSDKVWIQDSGHNQALTIHLRYRLGPDHNDEQVMKLKEEIKALRIELHQLSQ